MSILDIIWYFYQMNISFTKKQEQYIKQQVASGGYKNKSEVIREAIRLHEQYQKEQELKLINLKAEIKKGLDSGFSPNSVQDILKRKKEQYG